MLDLVFDLSHFNGQVLDFHPAAAAGFLAVVNKATQGLGYIDPTWAGHRAAALEAGLLAGSYHFGVGGEDGAAQAAHFLKSVGPHIGELLVLDHETNPTGQSMSLAEAADFVTAVHAAVGVWPVLYAGSYLKDQLRGGAKAPPALLNCPLWLAQYGPVAVLPAGWPIWSLWQYADGHTVPAPPVPGIGLCDRDRFAGDEAALRAFWAAHSASVPAA